MAKRILWVSRHRPLEAQLAELRRLFGGDTEVTIDPQPFDDAADIARRARGYDEVVVVAPLSVIARLVEMGVRPLWAEMAQLADRPASVDPTRHVCTAGRWYEFRRFRRILRVLVEYEEL